MTLKHQLTFSALGVHRKDSEGVLVVLLWQQESFLGELQAVGLTQALVWWQVESGRAHPERAPRSAASAEGQGRCHGAAEGPQG